MRAGLAVTARAPFAVTGSGAAEPLGQVGELAEQVLGLAERDGVGQAEVGLAGVLADIGGRGELAGAGDVVAVGVGEHGRGLSGVLGWARCIRPPRARRRTSGTRRPRRE